MNYKYTYNTPENFSNIIMNSDGEFLTGLWFEDSKDSNKHTINCETKQLEMFKETVKWLDIYFSGKNPNFTPQYKIKNLTPFCIIIPCHRVVGTNCSLTGYGGGIKNKVELLKLEGNDMSKYFIPKKGTAL